MAKKAAEEKINLDAILFKCRDILRQARNSGSFFEKRDMMLTLVFLRFIGEKFEDGVANLRKDLEVQGLDPDDPDIKAAFLDDPTFTDGTYTKGPDDLDDYDFGDDDEDDEEEYVIEDDQPEETDEV